VLSPNMGLGVKTFRKGGMYYTLTLWAGTLIRCRPKVGGRVKNLKQKIGTEYLKVGWVLISDDPWAAGAEPGRRGTKVIRKIQ